MEYSQNLKQWQHDHTFGQDQVRSGEKKTIIVIGLTLTMMVFEISTGFIFGSMALLADGLHMASHSVALVINVVAYIYARKNASNRRFSFGTGKVNALGGFTGAVLLAIFALMMAWGSVERIIHPVQIAFNQAILVAVIGLIVNGLSVVILGHDHDHDHGHDHPHDHSHDHSNHDHNHDDHNLKSAYFHVMADALTSVLAIAALLLGKYYNLVWMDPLMGIVGAILVCKWAVGLLKVTSAILLDEQAPKALSKEIVHVIESDSDAKVTDLHVWSIGPGIYSVILVILTHKPQSPDYYHALLPKEKGLEHVTIEVRQYIAS